MRARRVSTDSEVLSNNAVVCSDRDCPLLAESGHLGIGTLTLLLRELVGATQLG